MKKHNKLLFIVVAALVLAALSCGPFGDLFGGEEGEATQPPSTEAPDAATAPPQEATAPPEPEGPSSGFRSVDGMEMMRIPAGEFLMGDDGSPFAPERPAHTVFLDEYWIDRHEVSNGQYRLCVDAGVCAAPESWEDENLDDESQPALVLWESARTFCGWVGGRLPTEAEWEKAARGTDGRQWPWGNEFDLAMANLNGDDDGYGHTAPVGSFPSGASPYGLLNMAGNAAEWVADWFGEEYYAQSPAANPPGPASGEQKLVRGTLANGGGGPEKCRCVARFPQDPGRWEFGFRCVSDVAPTGEASDAPPATSAEASPEPTPAAKPSDSAGQGGAGWSPLQSYRSLTRYWEGGADGTPVYEFATAWNAGESAGSYLIISGGEPLQEEITVGSARWTRFQGGSWQETTLTAEEQAAWEKKWSLAQHWGSEEIIEDELEGALPEGVELVPAQIFPVQIKAVLVLDGEEAVNGVHCKRYTVDTDLDYVQPGGVTRYTGHAKGTVWIASQAGIPPVIVRAVMDEELTATDAEGNATTSYPYIEHDITDINQSVVVEPPE